MDLALDIKKISIKDIYEQNKMHELKVLIELKNQNFLKYVDLFNHFINYYPFLKSETDSFKYENIKKVFEDPLMEELLKITKNLNPINDETKEIFYNDLKNFLDDETLKFLTEVLYKEYIVIEAVDADKTNNAFLTFQITKSQEDLDRFTAYQEIEFILKKQIPFEK